MSYTDQMDDNAVPKRAWFRPTPDWLVTGLLVGTGILLVSERLPSIDIKAGRYCFH